MALARDLRPLAKPETTATHPSLFRDVIADYLVDSRGPALPVAGDTARLRHSWAGMCNRRIAYHLQDAPAAPDDPESLWSFAMGHEAHRLVQEAFQARYGDRCQVEAEVDLGERACHIDVVLRFDKPEPFTVDNVVYLCRTVAIELKSTGGFSWSMQVKKEGPKLGAYLQGCLNAAAVDADLMVVGYLSLDRQSRTAKELYGKGLEPLDSVWATWAYPKAAYVEDAEREAARLGRILAVVDEGRLPVRRIPELPKGAQIVDPASGRWEVRVDADTGPAIVDSGTAWQCSYCPFRAHCAADSEAGR